MASLHELNSLDDAIRALVGDVFGPELIGDYTVVTAEQLVQPYRDLLVHHDHMTAVLYARHGCDLELRVLRRRHLDDVYARFILLAARDSAAVLETGVVQINLDLLSAAVRQEVLEARKPLGSILIEHNVLRRIEPKWYLRLQRGCPLVDGFGADVDEAYGRVGIIYCDHQPAIELLEVVADVGLDGG